MTRRSGHAPDILREEVDVILGRIHRGQLGDLRIIQHAPAGREKQDAIALLLIAVGEAGGRGGAAAALAVALAVTPVAVAPRPAVVGAVIVRVLVLPLPAPLLGPTVCTQRERGGRARESDMQRTSRRNV
jgi:hypothetical protein